MNDAIKGSLAGVKVIDFSTLLPGPLASLFLAETVQKLLKLKDMRLATRLGYLSRNGMIRVYLFQCLTEERRVYH